MKSSGLILAAAVLMCGSVYADLTVDTARVLGPVKPMHGVNNGLFEYYTFAPLQGYYPFLAWSKLAALGTEASCAIAEEKVVVHVRETARGGEERRAGA